MSATATVNDSIDDAEAHLDRCDRQAQRFEILTAFLGCRHCHPQFRALVCLLFPVCKLLTLLLGAKHCLASQDPRVSIHVHAGPVQLSFCCLSQLASRAKSTRSPLQSFQCGKIGASLGPAQGLLRIGLCIAGALPCLVMGTRFKK